MFEDVNAWATLSEVLEDVLYDANLISTFLIIDAPFCEGLHASCRETTPVSPTSRAAYGLDGRKGLLRVLPQGACLFLRAEQLSPPSDDDDNAPDTAAQKADANL